MELPWSAAKAHAAAETPLTRAEIAEALTNQVHAARREFPVVGSNDHMTPWDKRHAVIDDWLYDWELAD